MSATSSPALPTNKHEFLGLCLATALMGFPSLTFPQADTEVFLLNLKTTSQQVAPGEIRNLSDNAGYDNQPSFYSDDVILFSSTRQGQTDVAAYSLKEGHKTWKTDTPGGGEYSPLKIPGSEDFSAIRLDEDGKQLLYRYHWETGKPEPLFNDLKVGYHLWYSPEILVFSVLVEDRMDLVISNLKDETNYTFQKNVGRSLHRIPNTRLVSFVNKEGGKRELKSVDPLSGATRLITELPPGAEDVCWLGDGSLLAGSDHRILQFRPGLSDSWKVYRVLPEAEIGKISRMAVNASSDLLLIVGEIPGKRAERP